MSERESKKCQYCGQTIYKFHSKTKNKDYWCSSNNYMDFHTDKKDATETKIPQSEPKVQNTGQSNLSEAQMFQSILIALGKLDGSIRALEKSSEENKTVLEMIKNKILEE